MIGEKLRTKLKAFTGGRKVATSRYAQLGPSFGKPVVLVTLLYADADTQDKAIQRHTGQTSHLPVFLVTNPDVSVLQDANCIFEHLPPPHMVRSHPGVGDWTGYFQERWRTLHLKWGPRWTVCYGFEFETYLQKCGLSGSMPE
jgi:hypothetical protein